MPRRPTGRGRARGERVGRAKLTAGIVRAIRIEHRRGMSTRSIAALCDVSPSTVSQIIRRETLAHVADD